MPLDHYVSQVYLKNFYCPVLGNRMHALRKADLKYFTPDSKSVCRIKDGNTNEYLKDDRAVEEFLKGIEPRYNAALQELRSGQISREAVYVVAGFVAYVVACSPAGMRIQAAPLKHIIGETTRALDAQGAFPQPPPELGGQGLTELLNSEALRIEVDPKYPQAMGITAILAHTAAYGNFVWEIPINPFEDSPLFTSDYPVAIERSRDLRILNRIVPLEPYMALRICPDPASKQAGADFEFKLFRYRVKRLNRQQVLYINRLIVRCAESVVFFKHHKEWVAPFVAKNAAYRIEPRAHRIPGADGAYLIYTQEVAMS